MLEHLVIDSIDQKARHFKMVSSQIPDTVRTPAQVIQSLWKSSRESAPEQDLSKFMYVVQTACATAWFLTRLRDDFPQIVGNHFRSLLNSENGLKEVIHKTFILVNF